MKRKNRYEIEKMLNEKGFSIVDCGDIKNMSTKIFVKCLKCGTVELRSPSGIRDSKNPKCSKCRAELARSNYNYGMDSLLKNAKDNDIIINCDDYKNSSSTFNCHCLKCGKNFRATARFIHSKNFGCRCREKNWRFKTLDKMLIDFKDSQPHIEIIDHSNYQNNKSVLTYKCLKCSNVWEASLNPLMRGICGCPKCASSKGEEYVRSKLNDMKITFKEQHSYPDCKYKKSLRFDFYIPEINTLVEVQGTQHYVDTGWFGNNFEENQKRDEVKRKYCKNNGINLIELNYNNSNIDKLKSEFEEKVMPLIRW